MDTVHNPDRFMADLRQILSQGRKRIGLLIGAGAPLSVRVDDAGRVRPDGKPLIPGVDALTSQVIDALDGQDRIAADAIRTGVSGGNIEAILSRIRLLQEALGDTPVNGLDGRGYRKLGTRVCNAIGAVVGAKLPKDRCAYHELVAWISGTQRPHPVEIFTTNYDLLLEEAFEASKIPYFDWNIQFRPDRSQPNQPVMQADARNRRPRVTRTSLNDCEPFHISRKRWSIRNSRGTCDQSRPCHSPIPGFCTSGRSTAALTVG